ncbi:hypothetical protein WA026_023383 [Henosepilachna vigintioctopunctata]|uniref:Polynucleotide 5'-hydroxyl-kinase NOL9 n=1 Tax=Henosepilachna vigintioctopunctata TaxID=420089 RepID=A0AAW1UVS5_9CUCU
MKHNTNRNKHQEIQSKNHVLDPVSQNSDCEKTMIKRRKKRKSVIFKPHKSPKQRKIKSPKLPRERELIDHPSTSSSSILKPSTSEILDIGSLGDKLSDDSISLNNDRVYHSKSGSSFNIEGPLSCTSSDSDLIDGFNEFYMDSELMDAQSTGDIRELMNDEDNSEKEHSYDVTDGLSIRNSNMDNIDCSEDMNDSFDLRINDLIENKETDTDSEHSESDFELFETKSEYIVVLKYSQTIKLFGYCNVRVLFGKINILGCVLTSKSLDHAIFSPRGTALLTLKNTSAFCDEMVKLKNLVPQLQSVQSIKHLVIRKDSSVVKFSKKTDLTLRFIENHISQWIFPKQTIYPCLKIEQKSIWNTISKSEEWDKLISNITSNCKIFICGGKGVGKSTFLRYTINCLIQKYEKVRVIDLDPGQSEFTIPGSISTVTVSEPLLGVNYTHLKQADRSILCDINVSQDPLKYVERIEELIKGLNRRKEDENIPTLINYMGYTNDIAYHVVSSAVVILQPTKIVYIHSTNTKKNYKIPLNKKNIIKHSKLFCPNSKTDFNVEVVRIPSVTDENAGWTLEPRQMREMCILAYFGKLMTESVKSLQDFNIDMYEVSLTKISVTDKENVKVSPDAINGNIVALCILANEDPCVFECVGWSIVRCINPLENKAIIITPLEGRLLENVTHFVVGCLTLPPSVYMNTEYVHDEIPYIMKGELVEFGQMSRRSLIPSNTTRK